MTILRDLLFVSLGVLLMLCLSVDPMSADAVLRARVSCGIQGKQAVERHWLWTDAVIGVRCE